MTQATTALIDEEALEDYYEGLCRGDYQSVMVLSLAMQMQVLLFAAARSAQWLCDLELNSVQMDCGEGAS